MAIKTLFFCSDKHLLDAVADLIAVDLPHITATCFSQQHQAETALAESEFAMVLAEENFLHKLGDRPVLKICLSDFTKISDFESAACSYLNVFQSRMDIAKDLMKIAFSFDLPGMQKKSESGKNIIAFFSTQGGCGVSTLSYLTALSASAAARVVYLNLTYSPSRFVQNTTTESGWSMVDILFSIKDGRDFAKILNNAVIKNNDGVYTFPNFLSVADVIEFEPEDIDALLRAVEASIDIDTIIIDLPCEFSQKTSAVLKHCTKIALVYTSCEDGLAKKDCLLADPSFIKLFQEKSVQLTLNKCKAKSAASDSVDFPYSQSINSNQPLPKVLASNAELREGCSKLLISKTIGGAM